MTGNASISRGKRRKSNSKSKQCNRLNLQKPSGVIGDRVKQIGGDKFAIVCIDPAKHRSEWMMADYYGNLLIQQQTLEHQAAFFKRAVAQIHEAQERNNIQEAQKVLGGGICLSTLLKIVMEFGIRLKRGRRRAA